MSAKKWQKKRLEVTSLKQILNQLAVGVSRKGIARNYCVTLRAGKKYLDALDPSGVSVDVVLSMKKGQILDILFPLASR